jgi:hypothetical protein
VKGNFSEKAARFIFGFALLSLPPITPPTQAQVFAVPLVYDRLEH